MCMDSSVIAWLTALLLAAIGFQCSAQAQVITPGSPVRGPVVAAEADVPRGTSTRELVKRFHRGRQLLADENYAEGSRLLQTILDSDEDAFFYPDQDHGAAERSLKVEAQSLLGRMPAAGRAQYEQQHGPAARRLLEAALRSHDVEALAVVARRYFHTQAGYDAAYHLAAENLDHDRPLTAALGFERLLLAPAANGQAPAADKTSAADRFEPYLSIQCALSWMRAGLPDKAQAVLVRLHDRYPRQKITIGGRDTVLFQDSSQALAWLTATAGAPRANPLAVPSQWTCVGGDARRNANSAGGSPYLNRGWRVSTVVGATGSPENDATVVREMAARRSAVAAIGEEEPQVPTIATAQPLIVDNLVIARSVGDIRAYDISTGNLAWASAEKDQFLIEMLRTGNGPQAQVVGGNPVSMLLSNRCWEDTTSGTLSSDGELVFAVEDLQLGYGSMSMLSRTQPFHNYYRLVAHDLKTGRAVWEAGGSHGNAGDPLAATYIVGAPLVLDRRLYCLGESGSEVRLLALDPRTGRLDWSQTLSTSPPPPYDNSRRQSGLSPSSFGDVLICPIASEQVVAVSLAQRSLSWRYSFKGPADQYDPRRQVFQQPVFQQQRGIQPMGMTAVDQNHWLDSHAIIDDLRVIITPGDAGELYCLNLLDGTLAWKKPRGEGLFVAGVHQGNVLVVGRSYVQALKLSDGEPAWQEPTSIPLPNGRGFVAGEYLYLPLATAEVAAISLRDGRIVARARSLAGNAPANLVAVRGFVVSQGADFIEAYRQLDALEAEIADTLVARAEDSQALALRGEIRLQRGNVADAYADLKRALELKSDDAAIKSLMVGSLLEGLRVDYGTYRKLEPEIEPLLTSPEERSTYLWLRTLGLRRAGEPGAALASLLDFAGPGVSDRDLERIDGSLLVRRDRLVRARTAELYAAASPQEREQVDRDFRARADKLREQHDVAGIRRLLRYFGGSPAIAEMGMLSVALPFDETDWLADEFRLEELCQSKEASVAAAATARLAQLLLLAGRPRDALVCVRRLEHDWRETICLDGKTGQAFASELRKNSDVAQEVALEAPWPEGHVEVERLGAIVGTSGQKSLEIPLIGERGPFFQDSIVQMGFNWKDFSARDALGRNLWKLSLDLPLAQHAPAYIRAYPCGHLLLLAVGPQILAIDILGTPEEPGPRLLWRFNLSSSASRPNIAPRWPGMAGRRRMMQFNQVGEPAGTIGPVTREQVTLLAGRKLMALDPLSGKPLWMREGVTPGTELFGDTRFLCAVAPDSAEAVVYDALDGSLLGNRPLPPANWRVDTVGRQIVTWRTLNNRLVLALFDPWSEKDVWTRDFENTAQLALIDLDEAAVLEVSGKVTILSLADGRVRFETTAEREPQVRQIHVLRSRDHYVLIANQSTGGPGWQQVGPQVIQVHGRVYGYDRQTGKRLWTTQMDRHGIDLHQPVNLPVLTFVSHFALAKKNSPAMESRYALTCLDKRNGRLVFDDRNFDEQILFVDYAADVEQKQLDLRLFRSVLRLTFTDKPFPEE